MTLIALVATACPGPEEDGEGEGAAEPPAEGEEPEEPADFIYAIDGVPSTLDLVPTYEGDTTRRFMYEIGSSLLEYDASEMAGAGCDELATIEDLKPDLAESWERGDDDTIRFELRQGVMSTEGNELTADDVVWSLNRAGALSPVVNFLYTDVAGYADSEPVTAVDDYTVEIAIADPGSLDFAVQTWGQMVVYDTTAVFEAVGSEDYEEATEYLTENIPNFGPWELGSFDPGNEVELIAQDDYWNNDERGNIERLIFRGISEPTTRMQLLQTGEIDYTRGLSFEQYESLQDQDGVNVMACTSPNRDMLMLNLTDERFADENVRQAISLAIDRQAIADGPYRGFADPTTDGLSRIAYDFPEGEQQFEHDVDRAQELLAEAGYEDGFSIDVVASPTRPGAHAESVIVLIQSMLEEIGITMNINMVPGAAEFSDLFFQGEYEAILYNEPPAVADPYYSLSLYNASWSFQNTHGYEDEQYDELTRGVDETEPGSERDDLVTEASDLIVETVPVVYLVERQYVHGWSEAISGWSQAPHGELKVVNIFKESD